MDNDSDRLAILRGLGAVSVRAGSASFEAVFDNEYFSVEAGAEVEGTQPVLTCRTSDVYGIVKGTAVEIGDESYRVVRHEPDGTGMSRLVLRK